MTYERENCGAATRYASCGGSIMSEEYIQTSDTTLSRDAFMNSLRILHSMEPEGMLPVGARHRFMDDPVEYLLRADDPTVDRIWAAIQERQPARYRA